MTPLLCPRCGSAFSRWRLPVPVRWHVCAVCGARLTLSLESAKRIGALGGLIGGGILVPVSFVAGVTTAGSWRFWVCWLSLAYVLGTITTMLTGRLALYDDVRRDPRRWKLFPELAPRPRRFLVVSTVVLFASSMLLILPRSLPLWLEIILELIIPAACVFGLIGVWHLLFGTRGVFRRSR